MKERKQLVVSAIKDGTVIDHIPAKALFKVIDILGLMGDSADNIPGCPGIGPKTAEKLIKEFGSIDGIYENIDKLKGKQKENLVEFEEQVRLSRKLAVIIQDVPIDFDKKSARKSFIKKYRSL